MSSLMDSRLVRIIRIRNSNGEEKMLEVPVKLDLERPKRPRTVFTDEQLEGLENAFNETGYLDLKRRIKLAEQLRLTDSQVKVWFQNRRTKQKRMDSVEKSSSTNESNFSASPMFWNIERILSQ